MRPAAIVAVGVLLLRKAIYPAPFSTPMPRRAELLRKTRETQVKVKLDLDGKGRYEVKLPEPFGKHMVETLARYASFDLVLEAEGDLEHHVFEDAAIALGQAVRKAMGEAPIERIADAYIPMDDALVLAAVDMVERPYHDIDLKDEGHHHFLRSLSAEGRFCLHTMVLRGRDSHHIVEATYKATGAAMRKALALRAEHLSTKGSVQWKQS
jgi:imidazoleglycerol-phosphate dehydratase